MNRYRCLKCNGLIYPSEIQYTDDYMCNCNQQYYSTAGGWFCPRCGKIHSPFSLECDCVPYEHYSSDYKTDGTFYING